MEKIDNIEYKGEKIYYFNNEDKQLGKDLVDNNYEVLKIFKNDKRSYVAEVLINNRKYVLKKPKSEYKHIQRKILTLVKHGECLNTLINLRNHIDQGITEFVRPHVAIVKRKYGMIENSSLLMEYLGNEPVGALKKDEEKRYYKGKIIDLLKKIHSLGYYHGDANVYNFNIVNGDLKIIDSQGKKMLLGNYRAHYDMITFMTESFPEMSYPYKKNIWYYLAFFEKKLKHSRFIRYYRAKKKRRRNENERKKRITNLK